MVRRLQWWRRRISKLRAKKSECAVTVQSGASGLSCCLSVNGWEALRQPRGVWRKAKHGIEALLPGGALDTGVSHRERERCRTAPGATTVCVSWLEQL